MSINALYASFWFGSCTARMRFDVTATPQPIQQQEHLLHELVHVIQWRLPGPDRFFSYANGLECFGYQQRPLEAMAYDAETAFASSTASFNVEKLVAEKLNS